MAQSKATHIGECQCCCRRQMLPKGRLAKYGYQVAGYGFFNGVCWAAGQLPYEVSCDFIKDTILPRLREEEARLVKFHEKLLTPATDPTAWYKDYAPRFGYFWKECELVIEKNVIDRETAYVIASEAKRKPVSQMSWIRSGHTTDLLVIATEMNAYKAKEIAARITFICQNIKDQERRVAEWKLTDLELVNKVV